MPNTKRDEDSQFGRESAVEAPFYGQMQKFLGFQYIVFTEIALLSESVSPKNSICQ